MGLIDKSTALFDHVHHAFVSTDALRDVIEVESLFRD
jgi:hypothetical protein